MSSKFSFCCAEDDGIERVKPDSREADEEIIVEHNRIAFSHSDSLLEDGSDDEYESQQSHGESSMGTRTRTRTDTEGSNVYPTSSEGIETEEEEVETEDDGEDTITINEGELSEEIVVSESVSDDAMNVEALAYDDDDVSALASCRNITYVSAASEEVSQFMNNAADIEEKDLGDVFDEIEEEEEYVIHKKEEEVSEEPTWSLEATSTTGASRVLSTATASSDEASDERPVEPVVHATAHTAVATENTPAAVNSANTSAGVVASSDSSNLETLMLGRITSIDGIRNLLENELEKDNDLIAEFTDKVLALERDSASKDECIKSLTTHVTSLKDKNGEYSRELSKLSSTINELVDSHQKNISHMTAQAGDIERLKHTLAEEQNAKKMSSALFKDTVEDLETRLKTEIGEKTDLEQRLHTETQANTVLADKLIDELKAKDVVAAEVITLNEELEQETNLKDLLKAEVNALTGKLEDTKNIIEQDANLKDLFSAEISAMNVKLEVETNTNASLKEEIEELRSNMKKQRDDNAATLESLEQVLDNTTNSHKQHVAELSKELDSELDAVSKIAKLHASLESELKAMQEKYNGEVKKNEETAKANEKEHKILVEKTFQQELKAMHEKYDSQVKLNADTAKITKNEQKVLVTAIRAELKTVRTNLEEETRVTGQLNALQYDSKRVENENRALVDMVRTLKEERDDSIDEQKKIKDRLRESERTLVVLAKKLEEYDDDTMSFVSIGEKKKLGKQLRDAERALVMVAQEKEQLAIQNASLEKKLKETPPRHPSSSRDTGMQSELTKMQLTFLKEKQEMNERQKNMTKMLIEAIEERDEKSVGDKENSKSHRERYEEALNKQSPALPRKSIKDRARDKRKARASPSPGRVRASSVTKERTNLPSPGRASSVTKGRAYPSPGRSSSRPSWHSLEATPPPLSPTMTRMVAKYEPAPLSPSELSVNSRSSNRSRISVDPN